VRASTHVCHVAVISAAEVWRSCVLRARLAWAGRPCAKPSQVSIRGVAARAFSRGTPVADRAGTYARSDVGAAARAAASARGDLISGAADQPDSDAA
jgi:hypothetical protein